MTDAMASAVRVLQAVEPQAPWRRRPLFGADAGRGSISTLSRVPARCPSCAILKDRGVVTERQLQEAIQHQVLYGGRLGTSLYELGFITEERLQEALARAHGVPGLRRGPPGDPAGGGGAGAQGRWPSKHKVFPYRCRGKTLTLLMVDPSDHAAVARIGYSLGFIVKHRGGARVPDDPAPARLLRRGRALALHRHAPAGRRRPSAEPPRPPRPPPRCIDEAQHARRGRGGACWPSASASSGGCCSSSCGSPGCWAGAARARAWTGRWRPALTRPAGPAVGLPDRGPRPDASSSAGWARRRRTSAS